MQRKRRPPAEGTPKPEVVRKRAPAKPKGAAGVSREADLLTMRTALLAAMKLVEPKDLARVCAELRAVDAELATLAPTKTEGQVLVDELRARRAGRTAS